MMEQFRRNTSETGKYVKIGVQVTVWFNADGANSLDPRSGGSSSSLVVHDKFHSI